jgi:hypothetical protein
MGNGTERGRPAGADGVEDGRDGKPQPGTDPFHFPLGDALALSPFDKEVWASPARLQEMQKLVGFPDDLFLRGNLGFQGFLSWGFFLVPADRGQDPSAF